MRVDELLLLTEGFGDTDNLLLGWLLILVLDLNDQIIEAIENGVEVIFEVMDQSLPHYDVCRGHLIFVECKLQLYVDHVSDSAGKRIRVLVDAAHTELIVQVRQRAEVLLELVEQRMLRVEWLTENQCCIVLHQLGTCLDDRLSSVVYGLLFDADLILL